MKLYEFGIKVYMPSFTAEEAETSIRTWLKDGVTEERIYDYSSSIKCDEFKSTKKNIKTFYN